MSKTITRDKHWDRSIGRQIILACVTAVVIPGSCEAQLFYDFVQEGTGDVLATLELTTLPATHEEIAGMTFTPAGETLFGFVSPYAGEFDGTILPWDDDGAGGLAPALPASSSKIGDGDPPTSSWHPTLGTSEVIIIAGRDPGVDQIALLPEDDSDPLIFAVGDWRLVPEPSALALFCLGSLGAAALRRRRA
jgi:hypothetical protein